MPPVQTKRKRSRKAFTFFFVAGAALLLAMEFAIYMRMMELTIGPVSLFSKIPPAAVVRELNVALLHSETTARLNQAHPDYYFDYERNWEIALHEAGISYHLISDDDLAKGMHDSSSVLVLPAAACLGDAERNVIRGFVKAGNGLVASGPLAARDEHCVWRGWNFLSEITGLRSPFTVTSPGSSFAGFGGERFFSAGVPSGYSLPLPQSELTVGVADSADVFWSDWKLRPMQGASPDGVALATHRFVGQGRMAWFGFNESLARNNAADRRYIDQYLMSAVRWVNKQPAAMITNWPRGRSAAVMVAEQVNTLDSSVLQTVALLKDEKVPGVFFLAPNPGHVNTGLLQQLKSMGEIAGYLSDASAEALAGAEGGPLLAGRHELEQAAKAQVFGFASGQGSSTSLAAADLNAAGYHYYLEDTGIARAVPQIVSNSQDSGFGRPKEDALQRMVRVSSNDLEVISNYKGPSPWGDDLANGFIDDLHRLKNLAGLYILSFQSNLLGTPDNRHILQALLRKIKGEPVWLASGKQLSNWWPARDKLRVEARRISPKRIRIAITNTGQTDLDEASAYLYLPFHPNKIHVTSAVFSLKLPHAELLNRDDIMRLDFMQLKAQNSYVYILSLDE